jgi:hypothetical protein
LIQSGPVVPALSVNNAESMPMDTKYADDAYFRDFCAPMMAAIRIMDT